MGNLISLYIFYRLAKPLVPILFWSCLYLLGVLLDLMSQWPLVSVAIFGVLYWLNFSWQKESRERLKNHSFNSYSRCLRRCFCR